MDFIHSPLGDNAHFRIADKTGFKVALLDVLGTVGFFLLGCAPVLIVIGFAVL